MGGVGMWYERFFGVWKGASSTVPILATIEYRDAFDSHISEGHCRAGGHCVSLIVSGTDFDVATGAAKDIGS